MIIDRLENLADYSHLHPNLSKLLDLLKDTDLAQFELGRNDLLGDQLFSMGQLNQLAQENDGRYEYHKRYTDIHIVLEGQEGISYGLAVADELLAYDESGDFGLVSCHQSQDFVLSPGYFALFLPKEPHHPNLPVVGQTQVKKQVIKVAMT